MDHEEHKLVSVEVFQPQYIPTSKSNHAYESFLTYCGRVSGFIKTWICCIFCESPYQTVEEGNVGVVQKFGKFSKLYAPGLYYINPCSETLILVDKRERILDVRKQICVTKDNIAISVDAVIYYQIQDTYKSLFSVTDLISSITALCLTGLRDVFGKVTLQQALEDREKLAQHLSDHLDQATFTWGIDITKCLIQEILFTEELQKSLSTAATAKRTAESKIIGAQADVQSARLMRSAADILNTPAAMQIRYLETITHVAKIPNPKVVFFPSEYGDSKYLEINKGNKM